MVQIVHAKMDENGKIDGPLVGDQTGKEILTQNFYLNDSTLLLVCKDAIWPNAQPTPQFR
jgi:hypothetical protein